MSQQETAAARDRRLEAMQMKNEATANQWQTLGNFAGNILGSVTGGGG